ncbi:MAG: winged helix-turn-helix domain-containing protein [Gammaproteobacteria bacterium]|nr:winged helix-turn-helix domain-containing protein [Gammaproteobacteria bacterium]MCW8922143.1 winged helix-turn-helix domain-containing protein [Gammaproteobacteria bacterium]
MNKILIVENEAKLAALLQDYLTQAGFSSRIINDGSVVIEQIHQQQPQLILFNTILGLDNVENLLRNFSSLAIILITERIEEIDQLLKLNLGADDYICKPFSPREVVARIKTVLYRTALQQPFNLSLKLDPDRFQVVLNGKSLKLTRTEFNMLQRLAARPGQVFTRDKLINGIYDDNRIVTNRTIDSHIKNLRHKLLKVTPKQNLIQSVYGIGYKFEH